VGTALKGASSGFSRAFVYENGIMLDLGTLSGGSSFGFGLNNLGDIVGDSSNQAFIYSNGSMKRIGTLGGAMSFARAINDAGQVVGYSYIPGNALRHAFIFQNGMLKDLTPSSLSETFAYGINDLGQVVGTSSDGFAFMYRNGIAIDLNTIIASNTGWQLTNGADINDAGQIAGAGFLYGAFHAFLLSPVPEPAVRTLIAFGLGLLGLAKRCQPHKIRLGLT
jgi:probable HAF family extracellular repeat protein